jgi:hypothetical protein
LRRAFRAVLRADAVLIFQNQELTGLTLMIRFDPEAVVSSFEEW